MQHVDDRLETSPAAWQRPGVVFVVYAYRFVVAALVTIPFSAMFGAAIGGYPRGDAVLFDDGALMLAEAMRRSNSTLPPLTMGALALLVTASFAGIMPLAALIGALGTKGRLAARDLGAFALRPVGTYALLFGAFALVQAIVAAIVIGIGGAVSKRPSFDAPTVDYVTWSFVFVALLVVCLFGVMHDVARVAAFREDLGFKASLRRAWGTMRRGHVRVFGAWALRAVLGAILIYAAGSIASRLGVDSSAKVFAGFLVLQLSVFGALFLRASWFAAAIRHVDSARPAVALPVEASAEPEAVVPLPEPAEVPAEEPAAFPAENPPKEASEPLAPEEPAKENEETVRNRDGDA